MLTVNCTTLIALEFHAVFQEVGHFDGDVCLSEDPKKVTIATSLSDKISFHYKRERIIHWLPAFFRSISAGW